MKKEGKDVLSSDWTRYTGIGFEMFTSVAFFGVIGYLVDRHWNIWPIGLVSGTLLGVVVGFYLMIKELFLSDKGLWKYMKSGEKDGKIGSDERENSDKK